MQEVENEDEESDVSSDEEGDDGEHHRHNYSRNGLHSQHQSTWTNSRVCRKGRTFIDSILLCFRQL